MINDNPSFHPQRLGCNAKEHRDEEAIHVGLCDACGKARTCLCDGIIHVSMYVHVHVHTGLALDVF